MELSVERPEDARPFAAAVEAYYLVPSEAVELFKVLQIEDTAFALGHVREAPHQPSRVFCALTRLKDEWVVSDAIDELWRDPPDDGSLPILVSARARGIIAVGGFVASDVDRVESWSAVGTTRRDRDIPQRGATAVVSVEGEQIRVFAREALIYASPAFSSPILDPAQPLDEESLLVAEAFVAAAANGNAEKARKLVLPGGGRGVMAQSLTLLLETVRAERPVLDREIPEGYVFSFVSPEGAALEVWMDNQGGKPRVVHYLYALEGGR